MKTMGIGSRSQLGSLANLLDLLSDKDRVKAHIDELTAATTRHDGAKKAADESIAVAAAIKAGLEAKQSELDSLSQEILTTQSNLASAQTIHKNRVDDFERSMELRTSELDAARSEHNRAIELHTKEVSEQAAKLDSRQAEIDQAARAIVERDGRISAREADVAQRESELATKVAQAKQLFG